MRNFAIVTRKSLISVMIRNALEGKWVIQRFINPSHEHELVAIEFESSKLQMRDAGFEFVE